MKAFPIWLQAAAAIMIVALGSTLYFAQKEKQRLRSECEAIGGMLISTRDELYTCVGKPPAPKEQA